jgi:D-beta-D-heptose 7-phosphate kinase/D-beta-D-heptose 1-phosphate adenosyltransferase
MNKVKTLARLRQIVEKLKGQDKRIVFTNGCFDLLHLGHIRYLQKAQEAGDILIVGLNSDKSVRALKGPARPLFTEKARAELLSALEVVDYVVIFDELTPKKLIDSIVPHVLVKGGDWKKEEVVGSQTVEAHGGRVVIAPEIRGYSTTALIERIRELK